MAKTLSIYGVSKGKYEGYIRSYVATRKKRIKGYVRKDGVTVKSHIRGVKVRVVSHRRVTIKRATTRFDIEAPDTKEGRKKLSEVVAKIKDEGLIPKKRHEKVEAEEFLEESEEYAQEGEWIEEEIDT